MNIELKPHQLTPEIMNKIINNNTNNLFYLSIYIISCVPLASCCRQWKKTTVFSLPVVVTVSIGVGYCGKGAGQRSYEIMGKADEAVYGAKRMGRNQIYKAL